FSCLIPTLSSLTDTPATDIYTLSLHDALPICPAVHLRHKRFGLGSGHSRGHGSAGGLGAARTPATGAVGWGAGLLHRCPVETSTDRKSTRLNSSHVSISYAVFCLKKTRKNSKT